VLTTAIPQLSIVEDKREARGKTRGAHWRSPILQNALDSNRECVFENILVQPRSPAEVLECVKVARQLELHLGVRGAGLAVSMGAFQRGPGMLIDMGSKMNTVSRMDSSKGIVECQAGAKIRDVRSYAVSLVC
jgi:FAD/FMN-containing dehydrogenase